MSQKKNDETPATQPAPVQAPAPATQEQTFTMTSGDLSKMVKEAASAAAMAAVMASNQNPVLAQFQGRKAPVDLGPECTECRQREQVCKGRHMKMVVYPKNPRNGRFFQGITINGVNYDSGSSGIVVTVPASNDIPKLIELFEKSEEDFLHGKIRQHNSGSIGPGARGFIPVPPPLEG